MGIHWAHTVAIGCIVLGLDERVFALPILYLSLHHDV